MQTRTALSRNKNTQPLPETINKKNTVFTCVCVKKETQPDFFFLPFVNGSKIHRVAFTQKIRWTLVTLLFITFLFIQSCIVVFFYYYYKD